MTILENLHVRELAPLPSPRELHETFPVSPHAARTVSAARQAVCDILSEKDNRLLVITGPCSIHDPAGALDYARKLAQLRETCSAEMEILMRVYFEKPRTTIGWKGLIYDPHLDGSDDIETGLRTARKLLCEITNLGLPVATEFLDPITPQYIADLVSWAAIGARTTESQTHRQMASGLSMPVGFKNATDGSLQVAIDAMSAAMHPHSFLGINLEGKTSIVRTSGNPWGHVVLRGGRERPNCDPASITEAAALLKKAGLNPVLMVDCSHANSGKRHEQQQNVWQSLIQQRIEGQNAIIGIMLESYLLAGNQPIQSNPSQLHYGISITDACIDWETTARLIENGSMAIRNRQPELIN